MKFLIDNYTNNQNYYRNKSKTLKLWQVTHSKSITRPPKQDAKQAQSKQ